PLHVLELPRGFARRPPAACQCRVIFGLRTFLLQGTVLSRELRYRSWSTSLVANVTNFLDPSYASRMRGKPSDAMLIFVSEVPLIAFAVIDPARDPYILHPI